MRKPHDVSNTLAWLVLIFVFMLVAFTGDPCSEWSAEEARELQCE